MLKPCIEYQRSFSDTIPLKENKKPTIKTADIRLWMLPMMAFAKVYLNGMIDF